MGQEEHVTEGGGSGRRGGTSHLDRPPLPSRKAASRRGTPAVQGVAPGKETYVKFQLLLGAGARVPDLLHPLLIATGQPVRLLGRQGHCGVGGGGKRGPVRRTVRSRAAGPPHSLRLCPGVKITVLWPPKCTGLRPHPHRHPCASSPATRATPVGPSGLCSLQPR